MTNSCGLYRSEFEHDACGVGFIAHIKGQKSHSIVSQALDVLKNLRHRGAVGADPLQGDGAGILIQIPDQLYRDDMMNQGVKLPPAGEYGVGMERSIGTSRQPRIIWPSAATARSISSSQA